jgi:hypothetical protein
VKGLGDSALKLGRFSDAIGYFRTLVVLLEVYYKFKIIQDTREKGHSQRSDRLLQLLNLNKQAVGVHNKLAVACCKKGDYQKSYLYIVCALFIYNNSLRMIDQSDPLKYPKKNTNDILMGSDKPASDSVKLSFSKYIQAFNESYKKTLNCYESIWKFIEHNSGKFRQEFFQAVKDGMDYFNQAMSFTKREFRNYVETFMGSPESSILHYDLLSDYQDNYTGSIEPLDIDEFVDLKVQCVVRHILQLKRSHEKVPSWISGALGENLDEYRKGKLNKTKVSLYFQFSSMNIDIMAEALAKMVFKSQNEFVALNPGRPVTDASSRRSKSFSRALSIEHTGRASRKSSRLVIPKASELLIDRLLKAESATELFWRVHKDLTDSVVDRMTQVFTAFKKKYKKYAKRNKFLKEEKKQASGKRNLEGNKQRQRIAKEEANPDLKIGIFLRQFGNVDTYKPPAVQSRFFREQHKIVALVKLDLHLTAWRDHGCSFDEEMHRSPSRRGLERLMRLPSDSTNILHRTADFYEDLQVRSIRKAKVTKKLNTVIRMKELDPDNKSKSSNAGLPKLLLAKPHDTSDADESKHKMSVWTIENSIDDLCKLTFMFLVEHISNSQFFDIKFRIDQETISFIFTFQESIAKSSKCEFCLNLPQELWILKEKLMLENNPEFIKTYNPVIFNILIKCFFGQFFSLNAKALSIQTSDLNRVENLKRQMGLMYPIEMTRLANYDFDYFRATNLFHQEFTKTDLDNLQALLMILCYYGRLVRSLQLRSPTGSYHLRKLDMRDLVDACKPGVQLLNTLFVLDINSTVLKQRFQNQLFRVYSVHSPGYKTPTPLAEDTLITLQSVLTLLERLAVHTESVTVLSKPTQTRISFSESKDFVNHLRRNIIVDEYGVINFADLGSVVSLRKLRKNINSLAQLLDTLTSELEQSALILDQKQALLLLFFLVLENSLIFQVEIDSSFKQRWEKGFSKRSSVITHDGEKKGAVKKIILEITVPKLVPMAESSINLSDLYFIANCAQSGIQHASKVRPHEHPLFDDLMKKPDSVFSFLMSLCINLESSPAISQLNTFIINTIQEERVLILEKTRCFYMIRKLEKMTEIKILYFYRFRYQFLKKNMSHLTEDMRHKLKQMIAAVKGNTSVVKQAYNNFFKFYELTLQETPVAETKNLDKHPLPSMHKTKNRLWSGLKESSRSSRRTEANDNFEGLGSMFDKGFGEVMQHISTSTNVASDDPV